MTDAGTIKARILLSEVVGRYVSLKRRGGEHWGLCPFHDERTPSFSVNNAKGVFNCFGCGASGNIFSFIQNIENVDFINAKKILGAHPGAGRIVASEDPKPRRSSSLRRGAWHSFATMLMNLGSVSVESQREPVL